ncbi:MAG: bifunctional serine/threonine-protein kinase/formylglycine-generating enzyme family protein [Ardenticatenaceae bacterium]
MTNENITRFAHYEVVEQLGKRGGFGTVYLARDTKLKREVAIKVLHSHLAADENMVKRFIREAQAMAKLNHPNIVIVHGVEDDPREPYIVMECVKGHTLKDSLRQGALPVQETLFLLRQMAAALDAAHEQGMVHRDVKPANVLIRHDGRVKLTDFGIVKILEVQDATLTPAFATVGTSRYMSPEQADINRQDQIGPASDIYALGIVAYEMLSGRVPFSSPSHAVIRSAHRKEQPPDPRTFNAKISAPIADVLMKVLRKQPSDRYPSAQAFVAALSEAAQEAPVDTTFDQYALSGSFSKEYSGLSDNDQEDAPSEVTVETGLVPVSETFVESPKPASPFWRTFLAVALLILVGGIAGGVVTRMLSDQTLPEPQIVEVMITHTAQPTEEPAPPTEVPASPTKEPAPPTKEPAPPTPPSPPTPTRPPSATASAYPAPTETQLAIPTATFGVGSTTKSEVDGMAQVYVPEGQFLMGPKEEQTAVNEDQYPQHTVYLDAFWIDQTEVTNKMFAAFLNEQGNQPEDGTTWLHIEDEDALIGLQNGQFQPKEGFANHPVNEVTWFGAAAYCEWAGGRLPTEAEWEKAARSTDQRTYPWGDQAPQPDLLNFNQQVDRTTEIGGYPTGASPYQALNMAGNVEEWVADWYDPDYYTRSPNENPTGPATGVYRVLRGGSWYDGPTEVSTGFRRHDKPTETFDDTGFRCVRSP